MTPSEALTQQIYEDAEEQKWEEEWKVVLNNDAEYPLSKLQALVLKQEIAAGNRGIVMFKTFAISIPFIVEFYRVKRFLKGQYQLPKQASEPPYKPLSPERYAEVRKQIYEAIHKRPMPESRI